MKQRLIILLISFTILSCTKTTEKLEEKEIQSEFQQDAKLEVASGNQKFWNKLSALCGQSFEGEITNGPANDDFQGKKLLMHVLSCDEDKLLIPFNVGDNRSRTWILTLDNNLITLKHDHRKEDGSEDEITMYGGTTSNSGLSNIAFFPADQETSDLIPYASTNVWWITINDSSFTYNLKRIGSEGHFTVHFDLSQPVEPPLPSWGWENFKSTSQHPSP